MKFYNILFYHIYELALRSSSNRDSPMFISLLVLSLCFMFNVGALTFLIEGVGITGDLNLFSEENSLLGTLCFMGTVASYYLYNGRYKRIHASFVEKRKAPPSTFKAIIVVLGYYIGSSIVLMLSGLYMHKHWIFSE